MMNNKTDVNKETDVNKLVKKLGLISHPEGGFYKELYRSRDVIQPKDERYKGEDRCASTVIYYLLGGKDFSAWHKVNSDELWQYCSGSPLTLYIIGANDELKKIKIGDALKNEDCDYQYTVPNGLWFCAVPDDPKGYTLVTCTVTPGFEFKDWALANQEELVKRYEKHEDIIVMYTRPEEKKINKEKEFENLFTN